MISAILEYLNIEEGGKAINKFLYWTWKQIWISTIYWKCEKHSLVKKDPSLQFKKLPLVIFIWNDWLKKSGRNSLWLKGAISTNYVHSLKNVAIAVLESRFLSFDTQNVEISIPPPNWNLCKTTVKNHSFIGPQIFICLKDLKI